MEKSRSGPQARDERGERERESKRGGESRERERECGILGCAVEINLMNFLELSCFPKERAFVFLLLFAYLQCDGGIFQVGTLALLCSLCFLSFHFTHIYFYFVIILIPIWSEFFFFFLGTPFRK